VLQTTAATMAEERVELRLYNSMTNEKEIFNTKVPGKVSMYVCGVTAYDYSHLGHARAAVSFDILYRYIYYHSPNLFFLSKVSIFPLNYIWVLGLDLFSA
jgi:hypothetical protein